MFTRILITVLRHRRLLWLLTAAILAATAFCTLRCGNYTNDLLLMFPTDAVSRNMYSVLQKARMSQMVQLEFDAGKPLSIADSETQLDAIADEISRLPNVASVVFRFAPPAGAGPEDFIPALPMLTSPETLLHADPHAAVLAARKTLALPGTPVGQLRTDPFGMRLPFLNHLADFQKLTGYTGTVSHEFLTDKQEQRTFMLVNTDFHNAPSAKDIQSLFNEMTAISARILPTVKTTIVSPLVHNLDNEQAIRRDILAVSLTSIAALVFLFFIVFHGAPDGLWLPLLPVAASVIVTGILSLVFHSLCLFILGICGGIAGLAVDQGIHVYTACTGRFGVRRLSRLWLPLALSVGSSAATFLLVATTAIPSYVQLGVFAALTLIVNFFLSFFLLPTLLRGSHRLRRLPAEFRPARRSAIAISFIWMFLSATAVCLLPRLKFNFSLQAMDGVTQQSLQKETEFRNRWRSQDAANIIVVNAPTPDQALNECGVLADLIAEQFGKDFHIFHPALLWPSKAARMANFAQWTTVDCKNRLADLKRQLAAECTKGGLPPVFFTPFFDMVESTLRQSPDNLQIPPFVRAINTKLLRIFHDSTTALIFIPGKLAAADADALMKLLSVRRNTALLSEGVFQTAAVNDILPHLKKILLWLLPVLLISLLPKLRHPASLLIIALPGVTAVLWLGGIAAAFGIQPNIISAFSFVMFTGLVLDYGIFALHHAQKPETDSIPTALVLSAVTTVLTTGALIASKHPVMFHTGLVLSLGILVTAVTALVIIPALLAAFPMLRKCLLAILLALIATVPSSGCIPSLKEQSFDGRIVKEGEAELIANELDTFNRKFYSGQTQLYSLKVDVFWHSFLMLLAVKTDGNSLTAVVTAANGVTLYSVKITDGQKTSMFMSDALPENAKKHLFNHFDEELTAIFLLSTPFIKTSFSGTPVRMTFKRQGEFPSRKRQTAFYDWDPQKGHYQKIIHRNFDNFCLFTFTSR